MWVAISKQKQMTPEKYFFALIMQDLFTDRLVFLKLLIATHCVNHISYLIICAPYVRIVWYQICKRLSSCQNYPVLLNSLSHLQTIDGSSNLYQFNVMQFFQGGEKDLRQGIGGCRDVPEGRGAHAPAHAPPPPCPQLGRGGVRGSVKPWKNALLRWKCALFRTLPPLPSKRRGAPGGRGEEEVVNADTKRIRNLREGSHPLQAFFINYNFIKTEVLLLAQN